MGQTAVILIGFMPNPRIYKRIEQEKAVCNVHLICWDRESNLLAYPNAEGYTAHVLKLAASNDPIRRLVPYQKFSARAMKLLKQIKPDLIHVQGLDMLKIAQKYKRSCSGRVSIIYEVADLHRLLVDEQKHPVKKAMQLYLRNEDRRLQSAYDLLVLTSEKYYETYFGQFIPREKMLYMPNIPNLAAFDSYTKKEDMSDFTVGFLGVIRYKKQMLNLIEAARKTGVRLLVAGYETEPLVIEPMCKAEPNIEWVGRFDFNAQAAELYGKCDAMYSVYDADMRNVRVALPNKLYEAVYCEMPLIVAKNTYLAELVEQWGSGVAVDHSGPEELIAAIEKLRDDREFAESIRENCRKHKPEINMAVYNQRFNEKFVQLLNAGKN